MLALDKKYLILEDKHIHLPPPVRTTLYDLIKAVSEETVCGEENLITAAVVGLMEHGNARFAGHYLKGCIAFSG
ncbi:MAG: hypothetical protein WCQ99_02725 [Pseudomonadota bacterium]